jgi:hypothetical protein
MLKHPVALALVLAVAILVALVVSALVWAKSYAPLRVTAYGPGFGVSEQPVGSESTACLDFTGCGHLAFVIHGDGRRIAEFHVVVKNDGRWPVTIRSADLHSYCGLPIKPEQLLRAPVAASTAAGCSRPSCRHDCSVPAGPRARPR